MGEEKTNEWVWLLLSASVTEIHGVLVHLHSISYTLPNI